MINYSELTNLIAGQFKQIDNNLVICDEQMFFKNQRLDPNTMYVVISYGQTSINLNKADLPLSITIVGNENEIEKTQLILDTYCSTFNNTLLNNVIPQYYTTAESQENFIEVGKGFRSAFAIEGLLLVSDNFITISKVKFKYGEGENEYEEFKVTSYNDNCENSLNPQDYPDKNKISSYGTFQTLSFAITGYPNGDSHLIQKLILWKWDLTVNHSNDTFLFMPIFDNLPADFQLDYIPFKCLSFSYNSVIEEFPVISATFSM